MILSITMHNREYPVPPSAPPKLPPIGLATFGKLETLYDTLYIA